MALALVISFLVALVAVPVAVSGLRRERRTPAIEKTLHAPEDIAPVETAPFIGLPVHHTLEPRSTDVLRNPTVWERVTKILTAMRERTSRTYGSIVELFVRRGLIAAGITALLLAATYLQYAHIGTDFLPSMDEGSIILDYWTPPGTLLTETDAMLRVAERVIDSVPGVESYSRRTGAQLGFFITEPNRGDYVIKLAPLRKRRGVDEITNELRDRIAAVEPAIHTDFGQLLEDNIGDLTGGTPQPIDVRIFGDDPVALAQKARQVAHLLTTVAGVEDVFNGITIAGPALQIRVDAQAAARYGLTTQTVASAVEPAITGTVAGQIRVGDRMYDLRIFAPADGPLSALKIRAAPPLNGLVPLSVLASVSTGAPEADIARENLRLTWA